MSDSSIDKLSLGIEKARIPIALIGLLSTLFVFAYTLYLDAYWIIFWEFGANMYDYVPNLNLINILFGCRAILYIPLILNTSAIKKSTSRLVAIGLLIFTIILDLIFYFGNFSLDTWLKLGINLGVRGLLYILHIVFFIMTFKAKKFGNFLLVLAKLIQIIYLAAVVVDIFTNIFDYVPFRLEYLAWGSYAFFLFMLLFNSFGLLGRSKTIKENIEIWKGEYEGFSEIPEYNEKLVTTRPKQEVQYPSNKISSSTAKTTKPVKHSATQTKMHANNTSTEKKRHSQQQPATQEGDMIFPIPRALFWCTSCNQAIKIVLKKDDIYQEHMCPTCQKKVISWWARGPKITWYKFLIGLTLMAGGLFAIMIESILNEGLIPVIIMNVLGIIYLAVGVFLFITVSKTKITGPPSDAKKILPEGVYEKFGQGILTVTAVATIGGLILFGIARMITGFVLIF